MSMKNMGTASPSDYSKLVPLLPAVMDFLRDRDLMKAAEHFHTAGQTLIQQKFDITFLTPTNRGGAIHAINALLKFKSSRKKQSTTDLDVILIQHDRPSWFFVVLKILSEAEPCVVPPEIVNLPLAKANSIRPAELEGTMKNFRQWMHDNFAFQDLKAFGEFCSLLRDSLSLSGESEKIRPLCMSLGRLVIDRSKKPSLGKIQAAGNILELCVKNCYHVFDFLPHKNVHWIVKGSRIGTRPTNSSLRFDKLVRDLETFFEFKDSVMIDYDVVPSLMRSYTIYQIAIGILMKYKCLPGGSWIAELNEGKNAGKPECQWFNEAEITFISESSVNYRSNAEYKVPNAAKRIFQEWKNKYREDEISKVVEEFVEKQNGYHQGLQLFMSEYVSEIRFIAESDSFPPEAKKALGISVKEIDNLMGEKLNNVAELEKVLNAKLRVLDLLPCEILQPYFRSGLLCKILLKHSEEIIKCYTEYNKCFEQSTQLAQNLFRIPASSPSSMHLHFMQIFNELRQTNKMLGSSVDVALQTPINYLPKLVLYFERIKKLMDKELQKNTGLPGFQQHPAYNLVTEAMSKMEHVMTEINRGVGEKSPVMNNSGSSFRLPVLSKVGTSSGGGGNSGIFPFSPLKRSRIQRRNQREDSSSNFSSFRGL